eukprot:CAMPEP_0171137468 /NCGR_PEP_ID=MMETSP0766_2-20121228/133416_1 /TAXON_ID=439317 /ORGANISM="Gambierdiscus australes, Strain CAWD 149" /LENGTH=63 /DNA_ID=CAMNT_0011601049 /DNA_START=32 /DNA_END=220 /DNA_ORIENTATION=+
MVQRQTTVAAVHRLYKHWLNVNTKSLHIVAKTISQHAYLGWKLVLRIETCGHLRALIVDSCSI